MVDDKNFLNKYFVGTTERFLCVDNISIFGEASGSDSILELDKEDNNETKEKQIISEFIINRWMPKCIEYFRLICNNKAEVIPTDLFQKIGIEINQAMNTRIYDIELNNTLISNAIYKSCVLYSFEAQKTGLDDSEWIKKYMQAAKIYNNEALNDRKILSQYHIFTCNYCAHSEECEIHAHDENIRRRPLFLKGKWNYYPIISNNEDPIKNDKKLYASNNIEILYHPLIYKTTMCINGKLCKDDYCPKAHNKSDIRSLIKLYFKHEEQHKSKIIPKDETILIPYININQYKTKPCEKVDHKDVTCKYYHNECERRRNPQEYKYLPVMCENIANSKGCPIRDKCNYCHTIAEYQYHPDRWKITPCDNEKCEGGFNCPKKHEKEIVLNEYNYKTIFEKLGREYDESQDYLFCLNSIKKDWKCSKCNNIINHPSTAKIHGKFIVCQDCAEYI